MDNQNEKDRCVNCGIRNVPLYLGLDNRLHCADHIGLLLPPELPLGACCVLSEKDVQKLLKCETDFASLLQTLKSHST